MQNYKIYKIIITIILFFLGFMILTSFNKNTEAVIIQVPINTSTLALVSTAAKTVIPTSTPVAIVSTETPTQTQPIDIGNPIPETDDDRNAYNGYLWNNEGWVPGLISFETQFLRMPDVFIGSAVFYAPDVMRANAEYRELSLDGVVGAVAIQSCSEIGHKVWLQRPGYDWEGPFLVVDCSRRNDLYGQIMFRDQAVEVDFDTAVRWRMARYGGQQNDGRWSTLTERMNNVIISKYDPILFNGNIVDLSVWFLKHVTYAKITENAYQIENYVPPGYNGMGWGELGFINPSNILPMWKINGEWITFP